ncbi:MAG: hypothetical protein U0324_41365 [Polyangiales bacterium]
MRPPTLLAAALAAAAACSSEPCTLVGCADALRVNFGAAALAPPYSVTIVADGEPLMFECGAGGGLLSPDPGGRAECGATGFSFPRAPRNVMITVRAFGDGGLGSARTLTATPSYSESRPNGPSCDPVCRAGAVTLP